MPEWMQAGVWGFVAGGALLLGSAVGYFVRVPRRIIAAIMAFGAGVLVSALSFELVEEAVKEGGFWAMAVGFGGGALVYTLATLALNHRGARHRKRSNNARHPDDRQPSEDQSGGSGVAIALGALLDGIPESIAIGLSLLSGGGVSIAAVAAVFLSNIPEGLSSAAGMKAAGRGAGYVFGVWGAIAVASGLAAVLGHTVFGNFSKQATAAITASAAGAILAMLASTMLPEAYEEAHDATGIITVAGFLAAFALDHFGG